MTFENETKQDKLKHKYAKYPRLDPNLCAFKDEETIETAQIEHIKKIKAKILKKYFLPTISISFIIITVLICSFAYIYIQQNNQIIQLSSNTSEMEKQISEQKQEIKRLSNRQAVQNNDNENNNLTNKLQEMRQIIQNGYTPDKYDERLCTIPDCNSRANNGSYYCSRHECTVSGCHEQIINDNSQYCLLHQCIIPDCTNERQANSYYCFSHECLYPSCHKKRHSDWGMHCAEHDN